MASHVQIVLREDVDKLGKSGELVRVRAGYARNYLIPRGVAVKATRGNIAQIEHEQRAALAYAEKHRQAAMKEAETIAGLSVSVGKKAGAGGRLYGSVTAQEVTDALTGSGFSVDRRKLVLPEEAIKTLGSYDIGIRIGAGVTATFKLEVVAGE